MNKIKKMKAIGNFIFAGSASIGVMSTELFEVDRILEISDEIVEQNAKHFIHNYPEIPVIIPSEWENEEYLEQLKKNEYDLLYSNCPCSGLSQINRNASVDRSTNMHFYRVFNNIDKIEPKAFIIENAPTTIKLGYPILKKMIEQLGDKYVFNIVKDQGGNHGVAMQRARTLITGYRKDVFSRVPLLHVGKQPRTTVRLTIERFEKYALGEFLNHELVEDRGDISLEKYLKDVPQRQSIRQHIILNWDKYVGELTDKEIKSFETLKYKMENGLNFWDKSPRRFHWEDRFPSMSSVANFVHPTQDRQLTVREYAAIMNYPDDFEFVKDAKVPVVQAIAQGVPANFFKYIANEVGQALLGNREYLDVEAPVVFQDNIKKMYKVYNMNDIEQSTCFEINKKDTQKMGELK